MWTLCAAPGSPPGYFVTEVSQTEVRVVQGDAARKARFGAVVGLGLGCTSLVTLVLVSAALASAGVGRIGLTGDAGWLLVPFMLIGGAAARMALWLRLGREEWRAGPGYVERRRGWSFSPRLRTSRCRCGKFKLWKQKPVPMRTVWSLYLERHGAGCELICQIRLEGEGDEPPVELRKLADLLADRTGWPVAQVDRLWKRD